MIATSLLGKYMFIHPDETIKHEIVAVVYDSGDSGTGFALLTRRTSDNKLVWFYLSENSSDMVLL